MIVTDADRRNVLRHYRQLRVKSPNPPATIMAIIRDCAADWVMERLAGGAEPHWPDVREWAAAAEYCRTLAARPDYWRRSCRT